VSADSGVMVQVRNEASRSAHAKDRDIYEGRRNPGEKTEGVIGRCSSEWFLLYDSATQKLMEKARSRRSIPLASPDHQACFTV
jgi:hypothetical protein